MQSNFFNSFFSFYMIFNYFIQPAFMILVVFFLFKLAKHLGNIDKQNKALVEKLQNAKCVSKIQENNETNNL